MGEILPDGRIQGYVAPCNECGVDIAVNVQGTGICPNCGNEQDGIRPKPSNCEGGAMQEQTHEPGTQVTITMGPVGVTADRRGQTFADPVVKRGTRGAYVGPHPEEPDWHMVSVVIDGQTYYAPLPESGFERTVN